MIDDERRYQSISHGTRAPHTEVLVARDQAREFFGGEFTGRPNFFPSKNRRKSRSRSVAEFMGEQSREDRKRTGGRQIYISAIRRRRA